MYLDNVKAHVLKGSLLGEEKNAYRIGSFLPSTAMIFACIFGGSLREIFGNLLLAMFLISLACVIIVFKVSKYGLFLHEALWLDAVISVTWFLNISILELFCFLMVRNFTPLFFLIYLPNVIVPLLSGFLIWKSLKNKNYGKKASMIPTITVGGLGLGLICRRISRLILKDASQKQVFMFALVTLCLLNCGASLGFLSLQKLYFIKKYKISM